MNKIARTPIAQINYVSSATAVAAFRIDGVATVKTTAGMARTNVIAPEAFYRIRVDPMSSLARTNTRAYRLPGSAMANQTARTARTKGIVIIWCANRGSLHVTTATPILDNGAYTSHGRAMATRIAQTVPTN